MKGQAYVLCLGMQTQGLTTVSMGLCRGCLCCVLVSTHPWWGLRML